MVEDIKHYERKWLKHLERLLVERVPWQAHYDNPIGWSDVDRTWKRLREQF
jgi:hypothetical protein